MGGKTNTVTSTPNPTAAGGSQAMQQHNHAVTDPGHIHNSGVNGVIDPSIIPFSSGGGLAGYYQATYTGGTSTGAAATGISIQNNGSGSSQNVQPSVVSHLPLIKT